MIERLKGRYVFRIAAGYAVTAWVLLQILDVLIEPLGLPPGIIAITLILLVAGFPVALLASLWLKSEEPDGDLPPDGAAPRNCTNADVLSSELSDLPAVLLEEAIGAIWDRESQIVKQNPRFVVIHRSAFFHSVNQELGFGYSDQPDGYDEARWRRLYEIADNKLVAFLGYLAESVPEVRFIVYSRGTGGGWPDPAFQQNWVRKAVNRFGTPEGRIDTFAVPGGVGSGSFRNPEAS